jgi:ribosomal protein S21
MITVKVRRGDDPNRAMQKLKNLVIREGLYKTLKDRRYFRKPSLKRRLKREDAVRQRVKDMKKDIKAAMREEEN